MNALGVPLRSWRAANGQPCMWNRNLQFFNSHASILLPRPVPADPHIVAGRMTFPVASRGRNLASHIDTQSNIGSSCERDCCVSPARALDQ